MVTFFADTPVASIIVLATTLKVLLIPSYFSTDFDVHRNWLAITRHLPLQEWYFDDVGGQTVHTLDYPPGFAWFEYLLSNNFITNKLLETEWLDERCLQLLPDNDNTPSERCVVFHRCTVIISDVVLYLGAYLATNAYYGSCLAGNVQKTVRLAFVLIVTNPGLIMLDHIHFQYNGMLLGILLCSIACIILGASSSTKQYTGQISNVISKRAWELLGASFFAVLLSMKHLYMTLAPLYLVYLFRHHCFIAKQNKTSVSMQFSVLRFILLGMITLVFFLGPFAPFLIKNDPIGQMEQILKRLFPFGRGLVHDYWAANIWALYLFASKILSFIIRKSAAPELYSLVPFPEPSPHIGALCLLVGLVPPLFCAWKATGDNLKKPISGSTAPKTSLSAFFINAVVFSSFSAFMLGYHVHEKAIMTAIIPLTLLATTSISSARLFIRACMFGLFGLFPLLFRPEELLVKTFLFLAWMYLTIYGLESLLIGESKETLLTSIDTVSIIVLSADFVFMELIHPVMFMPDGKFEFLPLMTTSVICSFGLFYCWIQSAVQMLRSLNCKTKQE